MTILDREQLKCLHDLPFQRDRSRLSGYNETAHSINCTDNAHTRQAKLFSQPNLKSHYLLVPVSPHLTQTNKQIIPNSITLAPWIYFPPPF